MADETYARDAGFMEHAVACLAAITLRSPANAQRIVHSGEAVNTVAQAMRRFADRSGLQRQGALMVRNIAARCPELRPQLLDAGLEDVLRAAGRMQDVVDEAYGALRDMGCEVQYVKINAEGKVEPMYEQFGGSAGIGPDGNHQPKKLNFNPVYDNDVNDMEQRVAAEARAPQPNANIPLNSSNNALPALPEDAENDDDGDITSQSLPPQPPTAAATGTHHQHQHQHAHEEGSTGCCDQVH